jgi:hypothetical protein
LKIEAAKFLPLNDNSLEALLKNVSECLKCFDFVQLDLRDVHMDSGQISFFFSRLSQSFRVSDLESKFRILSNDPDMRKSISKIFYHQSEVNPSV